MLVQEHVVGVELAYGVLRDPTFGPLVMVASGGTSIALYDDETFLMPPLDSDEVRAVLGGLRGWRLLNGFRGSVPLDVNAVVAQVVSLGRLHSSTRRSSRSTSTRSSSRPRDRCA